MRNWKEGLQNPTSPTDREISRGMQGCTRIRVMLTLRMCCLSCWGEKENVYTGSVKKKRKERKWNRNSCSKRHSRLKLDTGAVVIHHRSVNSHNAQGKAVWPWVNCWFYKRFSAPPCGVHPNCNTRVSFRTQTGFPILTNSLSKPASLACSPPKAHLSSITVIKRPNQVCWSRKTNKGKAGWKVYRKTLRLAKRRGSLAWNLNTNSQW